MLNVAALKDIMDVGETIDPSLFEIIYDDGAGSILSIQDYGSYQRIVSNQSGDVTETYFVFLAMASGETSLNYKRFMDVLNGATDTDLVHFANDAPTLPDQSIDPIPVVDASFIFTKVNTEQKQNVQEGKLTLTDYPLTSSSSSSSS